MEGVFEHLVFGMRRKEKAQKEKKPVDWAYPISYLGKEIGQVDGAP